MTNMKSLPKIITFLTIFLMLSACQNTWQMEVITEDQQSKLIDTALTNFYIEEIVDETEDDDESVSLSYLLSHHGFSLIEELTLYNDQQTIQSFEWDEIYEMTRISTQGEIIVGEETFQPTSIHITTSPILEEIDYSIMDISPTVLSVLELPPLSETLGQSRTTTTAERAVMIFVDGLQYKKLITLIEENTLPFFKTVEEINTGLTVFPAITTSSSAALFTGLPPKDNGVYGYGYRSTEKQTLLDIVAENGLKAVAVEGHGLAFSIRNAEVILSGDRNNDGYTNDNVLSNSLEVITNRMPDLLFIHFHDVDDMGHEFGPDSEQYETAIKTVDSYIAQIVAALPENTFITIFADHGMQNEENGNGGNHGQLTKESMIIPIIFMEK